VLGNVRFQAASFRAEGPAFDPANGEALVDGTDLISALPLGGANRDFPTPVHARFPPQAVIGPAFTPGYACECPVLSARFTGLLRYLFRAEGPAFNPAKGEALVGG